MVCLLRIVYCMSTLEPLKHSKSAALAVVIINDYVPGISPPVQLGNAYY